MDLDRARMINGKLVACYMANKGIVQGQRPPPLTGITLAEALEATRMVGTQPPQRDPDGQKRFELVVAPVELPKLYAWSVLTMQTLPPPER